MNEIEKQKIVSELKDFFKKLRSYQNRQRKRAKDVFSEAQDRSLNAFRLELQRYHARVKHVVSQYGGGEELVIPSSGAKFEVFWLALHSLHMGYDELTALDGAISLVNKAIARFESLPIAQLEVQKVGVKQDSKDIGEGPVSLFDKMQFHPKVIEVSRALFADGHYRDAIYRAFVEVNNFVKAKSNKQLDGKGLMSTVFSLNNPVIKINSLETQTDKDEQEGFMYLFMGAMQGIRNPNAHENIIQNDPYRTLWYLGFASLLMKIAEEGKLV